jgi:hypothetical protein
MAYKSSDGKQFSNRPPMKSHEASLSAKKQEPLQSPVAEEGQGPGGEAPEQVAAQHGPATEVHVMHDHGVGHHSVHSVHPDGHEHHSEHGSAEEAHDHAKALASGGHGEPDGDEGELGGEVY